jgi:Tfp pilus assembly protein PilO
MSARDRLVLMGIAALAVVGAVWMLAVSPARKQASTLAGEVSSVQGQLAGVKGELASASEVQVRYRSAYTSLVTLGKAVPTADEVPGLMYAVDQAANHKKVQFTSISSGGKGSGSSSSSSSSSSTAGAAAQSLGFHQMPFTFTFSGSYQDLCRLLVQLENFTAQGRSGALRVSGRLLTIQSITLGGTTGGSTSSAGASTGKPGDMTWTITASAYVLPASAGGGATPAGVQPSGATTTPTSSPGGSVAPAPAVVKVSP